MSKRFHLQIGFVETIPSCIPVHSFVVIDDIAIDAHGLGRTSELLEKYATTISQYEGEESVDIYIMNPTEGLNNIYYWVGDKIETNPSTLIEFSTIYPDIFKTLSSDLSTRQQNQQGRRKNRKRR